MSEFSGKWVLVTGGARGLGHDIARAFAEKGALLILVGRSSEALSTAQTEIAALGTECEVFSADLTDAAAVGAMVKDVEARVGPPDIIVTAAGARNKAVIPIAEADFAEFEDVLFRNLRSTMLPLHAFAPGMIERGSGRIVAISGVFGLKAHRGHGATACAKWAIEGFVRTLALEMGGSGITVNAVCPGFIESARLQDTLSAETARGGDVIAIRAAIANQAALGRIATPEDVAAAVLFLAGAGARNITGQDIVVDAGWSL